MNRKLLEDLFSSSWVDAFGESFFSSVEFAISMLESLEPGELFIGVNNKIQELEQYLNE